VEEVAKPLLNHSEKLMTITVKAESEIDLENVMTETKVKIMKLI
jgi:hypothetical protein